MLCGKNVYGVLSLCLNLEITCYLTVELELLEKGINNYLTTVHKPIINTLVHIVRFCARESIEHAQKEHKVKPRLNFLILKIKIGVYY